MSNTYKLIQGSTQYRFAMSRSKIQIMGGAYGNGKSAAKCIKVLRVARDYPGANILMARSTLKKLNDTLRKEFVKWLPEEWIERFPLPDRESTICELKNGSVINFNYIAQRGKTSNAETTSNVLSATYDLIVVDQMEDPEITYKDFLDLVGRLRGKTPYDPPKSEYDDTMPKFGPRWFLGGLNPTRNWAYRKVIKPYHDYVRTGIINEGLIVHPETKEVLIEVYESGTSENVENVGQDYIDLMRATYSKRMAARFIDGEWGAYEGLIYPSYNSDVHMMPQHLIEDYYWKLRRDGKLVNTVEGFDYGMRVPSCYLVGFVDTHGILFVLDGFYEAELSPNDIAKNIHGLRCKYRIMPSNTEFFGDPQIFKRTAGSNNNKVRGKSIYGMIDDEYKDMAGYTLNMMAGNNDIRNGIAKVSTLLEPQKNKLNPITGHDNTPYIIFSDSLTFVDNEISDYYWKASTGGDDEGVETPRDHNDHAVDTIKYMVTNRPQIKTMHVKPITALPDWMCWHEIDKANRDPKDVRYGR